MLDDNKLINFLIKNLRNEIENLSASNSDKTLEIERLNSRIRELESELATNNVKKSI